MIFASELAACINKNKYKSVSEALANVWARNDYCTYTRAIERNEIKEIDIVKEMVDNNVFNEIKEIITNTDIQYVSSDKLKEKIKSICKDTNLSTSVTEGTPEGKRVIESIKSYIHTEKGNKDEDKALNIYEKQIDQKIVERNTKFYKTLIEFGNGSDNVDNVDSVYLGGRIDGITSDGTLVEVKNRQYRFFNTVPIYEKVQVHAYMKLLNKSECNFVQNFRGKSKNEILLFDSEFWNEILDKLSAFVNFYTKLQNDESLQDKLLNDQVDFDLII